MKTLIFVIALVTACGGGGSNGDSGQNTNICEYKNFVMDGSDDCAGFKVAIDHAVLSDSQVFSIIWTDPTHVTVHNEAVKTFWGKEVYDLTNCFDSTIQLSPFISWNHSALAHGIAHLMDCKVGHWYDTQNHPQWGDRGIYAAVDQANNY